MATDEVIESKISPPLHIFVAETLHYMACPNESKPADVSSVLNEPKNDVCEAAGAKGAVFVPAISLPCSKPIGDKEKIELSRIGVLFEEKDGIQIIKIPKNPRFTWLKKKFGS
jgi:hypothetical protein